MRRLAHRESEAPRGRDRFGDWVAEHADALGRRYVEETFGAEGKARTQSMVTASRRPSAGTSRSCPG